MPGFPVLHHLPEFAQTHVHQVGDATQPLHSLSPLLLLPSTFPSIRVFSDEPLTLYVTLCTFRVYFLTSALFAVILDVENRIFLKLIYLF